MTGLLMTFCDYLGNSVKDAVSTPRPSCPPVRRVTATHHEKENADEYEMPSSNILNTICLSRYVSAQVIHSPTATVAFAASSQEKALRPSMESTRDVAAAAKIGKILGERLMVKDIVPAVSVVLKRDQKYHGKVKAVIDSLRDASIKLV